MKNFTFYEQVGILIPGAVFLAAMTALAPAVIPWLSAGGTSVGDLGIFLVVAYAAGHAVAALGNLLEKVFWRCFGGMPTEWLVKSSQSLLTTAQVDNLRTLVKERCGIDAPALPGASRRQWAPIYGQIYRDVLSNNPGRIETFNGNYGLNRGLAAALGCIAIALAFMQPPHVGTLITVSLVLMVIYLYRMYRFGVHFAREVYFSFLIPARTKRPVTNCSTGVAAE